MSETYTLSTFGRIRRSINIVGLMMMLCAICASISSALASPSGRPGCQLTRQEPDYDSMVAENVRSADSLALAHLAGSLRFNSSDHSIQYAKVNLTAIKWNRVDESTQELTLTDACAEIKFYTQLAPNKQSWQLYRMNASFVEPGGASVDCYEQFYPEFYPVGKHLKISAPPRQLYGLGCYLEGRPRPPHAPSPRWSRLELHYRSFEFELNGNPGKIKEGQFSTEAYLVG